MATQYYEDDDTALAERLDEEGVSEEVIPLSQFIAEFGNGLLDAVQKQNPSIYDGNPDLVRKELMEGLLRKPFEPQQEVVQAVSKLLIDHKQPAAIINAEMGTGKTMMAIAAAAVLHDEGFTRSLVVSPPHLVYKWRREIKATVPNARVWILNGPDTSVSYTHLPPLGNISAAKLTLDSEFSEIISSMVKSGIIGISGEKIGTEYINHTSICNMAIRSVA